MKKLILLALLAILVSSCQGSGPSETDAAITTNQYGSPTEQKVRATSYASTVEIVVIDSCEYVLYDRGIAHKGNCKNPIHHVSR